MNKQELLNRLIEESTLPVMSKELESSCVHFIQQVFQESFWIAGYGVDHGIVEVKIYFGEHPRGVVVKLNAIQDNYE